MFDLLSIKKTVDAMQERVHTLKVEASKLNTEIAKISGDPANKEDLVAIADDWINQMAAGFSQSIVEKMQKANYLRVHIGMERTWNFGLFQDSQGDFNTNVLGSVLCTIAGDQIKAAIRNVVAEMDWPNEGLSAANRLKELDRLQEKIKKINLELTALYAQAEDAGVELN